MKILLISKHTLKLSWVLSTKLKSWMGWCDFCEWFQVVRHKNMSFMSEKPTFLLCYWKGKTKFMLLSFYAICWMRQAPYYKREAKVEEWACYFVLSLEVWPHGCGCFAFINSWGGRKVQRTIRSTTKKKLWKNYKRILPSMTWNMLASYYFNVFIIKHQSYQNLVTPKDLNSDDDKN